MRTCGECGYLLPEAWDACKRCGAPVAQLPSSAAFVPRAPVAAVASGPSVRAAPEPGAAHEAYDARYAAPVRLGIPPAAPEQHQPWAAPAVPPGRGRSWPVAVAVVAIVIVGAGAWFGWKALRAPAPLPAEARAYVDGAGVAYEPFNQGFRVRMTKSPIESTQTVSQGGLSVVVTMGHIEHDGRYEMLAGGADLGIVIQPELAHSMLSGVATGIVAAEPGVDIVDQRMLQFEGWPALDVRLTAPDGHPARALVVLAGSRLVIIFTHATSDNDDLFEAMQDSLELVP